MLNVLCGFGIGEVASAFFCSMAAMEKRITRAKKSLAGSKTLFDLSTDDLSARLPAVHRALYLLFNEGYHGACPEQTVRVGLCREAMELCALLRATPLTATPSTHALSALMCLDAARLGERTDAAGELRTLFEQDRSRWDGALVADGVQLLALSATGTELTEYHVEAGIAALHAAAARVEDTRFDEIVSLYDVLMIVRPSPVVALNRAIAVAQAEGPDRGIEELRAIGGRERLDRYPFYAAALGELERRRGRLAIARRHFGRAAELARNERERRFLEARARACAPRSNGADGPDAERR